MNKSSINAKTVLIITISILLCGCLGNTRPVRPDAQIKAENLLNRGLKAEMNRDNAEADRLFSESLALSSSIEDTDNMARVLINQARLYRLNNRIAQAEESIDAAIRLLRPEAESYAEASHEKALIELTKGQLATAGEWAGKAVSAESGSNLGRRLNLLARIKLQGKDNAGASELLKKALNENHGKNDEEEANSLRMLAIISRNEKDYPKSEKLFSEALSIDKRIGISSKIALDLEELGQTNRISGKPELATGYLQRAYLVNLGAGRIKKAVANQSELAALFAQMGDRINTEKSLKTLGELTEKTNGQAVSKSPDTTNPSKRP